jgi:hypothetical protein
MTHKPMYGETAQEVLDRIVAAADTRRSNARDAALLAYKRACAAARADYMQTMAAAHTEFYRTTGGAE